MKNYQDLCRIFDVDAIGDIRWAHAVNTRSRLDTALSDARVHVIEGDVRVGPDGILTMAHERNEESELSFQEWVQRCIESSKGIKVDWKEQESFAQSITGYQKILR